MRLWDKGVNTERLVLEFTTARDRMADAELAVWDIAASMAHCMMLRDAGLLNDDETRQLLASLVVLYEKAERGEMVPGDEYEDIHSMVEDQLTAMTGETGMKIHAGRSRNDQIATDINLYLRYETAQIATVVSGLLRLFAALAERHRGVMIPGYTHLQPAMPSTLGLWFGSYAEGLCDDLEALEYACRVADASPAGTAAGYGTTLPLRREVAADLLGFARLVVISPYAQGRRGRSEKAAADAIASVAQTLGRFAGDTCLFVSKEFGFLEIGEGLTTGSSIMPHKKNPDVFEIIRARSNVLRSLPNTISILLTNLPPGYNRDYQVLKEVLFPAVEEIKLLVETTAAMVEGITVKEMLTLESYGSIFSADEANRLVLGGVPFRQAYRIVAGRTDKEGLRQTTLEEYSHTGSPGNPCIELILKRAAIISERVCVPGPGVLVAAINDSFPSSQ